MFVYAATIFLSAFLLFQVQPLIARFILPWFGGSAAVWSAALLFFQLVLLGGYFYAHCLIRYLKPKAQLVVHLGLLFVSLSTLPIVPSAAWKVTGGGDPTMRILLLLGATVGLPYMLLSATSPLLQAWYLRTHKGAIPYRLFALSNLGSMLALLTYPTLIEPALALHSQAVMWSSAFAVFAVVCALAAWKSREGVDPIQLIAQEDAPPPGLPTKLLWIGLAACASVLLLAVTSHLTQNLAPIPLLWVAPLSLYLLSFILCFESDRLYNRIIFLPLLVGALMLFTYGEYWYENNYDVVKRLIPALCGALFVCCMVCHGELARRRPHPRYLTQFYLMVSIGGALGGLFVALASPRIFRDYMELPAAMAAMAVLVTCVLWNQKPGVPRALWMRAALVIVTLGLAVYLGYKETKKERIYVRSARNFYGVLHVRDDAATSYGVPAQRVLVHGTIDHGTQLLQHGSERIPTSYFGYSSGVTRAIRAVGKKGPIKLGILGLGAGVTASLARAGDTLHYYEINPLVLDIATHQFGFLPGCPADKQVYLGDGRLLLESLPDEHLDFFALDAFTSDSVPVHLLTREAYKTYLRHLKPDGVMAINISNRYLNLGPVVAQAMTEMGWSGVTVDDEGEDQPYYSGNTWVVLARSPQFFDNPSFKGSSKTLKPKPGFREWTDDFSNLIQILK
jgi:hypothetical protein